MRRLLMPFLAMAAALGLSSTASAGSPGLDAIKEFKNGHGEPEAVQNRFFLKSERFEVAPWFGYVPNNPFAKRYVGGLSLGYHFRETLAAEGTFSYAPDLGLQDLKGLTPTLVQIAQTGAGGNSFQQPLDKVTLAAAFDARWAPIYGKINLVGETVLNFDAYGTAGLGMVSKVNYNATYDPNVTQGPPVHLERIGNSVKLTPVIGFGSNFFLNQSMALKIDARMQFYVDKNPTYDVQHPATGQRLYDNFVASVGLGFYFPKMKPRLYNF